MTGGDLVGRLPRRMVVRLSAMMFLQYAIFGVWAPVLSRYLKEPGPMGFTGTQTGLIFMTWALASILTPLLAGQLADRHLSTQHYLAGAHLLGAGLLFALTWVSPGAFWVFFLVMLAYQLLCAPTMSLTSSLAFHHLPNGDKQFGMVRLWGTLGWIFIGLAFGEWLKQGATFWALLGESVPAVEISRAQVGQCLIWAALLSLACGLYCLTLPNTPPARNLRHPYAFLEGLKLMRERSFAVLLGVAVLVATELQFYFVFAANFFGELGFSEGTIPQLLILGQVVEVGALALLPWFVTRFGIKTTIIVGILAWPLRYGIFALGWPWWLVVASQGLHGLAFGFFFVGSQLYVDKVAGKDLRASAQSLLLLAVMGVGKLISSLIAGPVVDVFSTGTGKDLVTDWRSVFLVPVAVTLVGALLFLLLFREKKSKEMTDLPHPALEPTMEPKP